MSTTVKCTNHIPFSLTTLLVHVEWNITHCNGISLVWIYTEREDKYQHNNNKSSNIQHTYECLPANVHWQNTRRLFSMFRTIVKTSLNRLSSSSVQLCSTMFLRQKKYYFFFKNLNETLRGYLIAQLAFSS